MLPRLGTSKLVTRWIAVTIVASIIAAVDGGWLASWAALAPTRIWHGEVWRLVTWPFVEPGPMSLVLTCAAIYKFGGELAVRWGDRRLQRFATQVVVAAAVATSIGALVFRGGYVMRLGGWAVGDMLVIAWARQFPQAGLQLYGLITLRGRDLIAMTVGTAVLFAIFYGPIAMAPELVACGAAALYPTTLLRG